DGRKPGAPATADRRQRRPRRPGPPGRAGARDPLTRAAARAKCSARATTDELTLSEAARSVDALEQRYSSRGAGSPPQVFALSEWPRLGAGGLGWRGGSFGGQAFGALLDPLDHLALHDQRAGD